MLSSKFVSVHYLVNVVTQKKEKKLTFDFMYRAHVAEIHHLRLTIAQLAEHLTVESVIRNQSVLGSIPSGEICPQP